MRQPYHTRTPGDVWPDSHEGRQMALSVSVTDEGPPQEEPASDAVAVLAYADDPTEQIWSDGSAHYGVRGYRATYQQHMAALRCKRGDLLHYGDDAFVAGVDLSGTLRTLIALVDWPPCDLGRLQPEPAAPVSDGTEAAPSDPSETWWIGHPERGVI